MRGQENLLLSLLSPGGLSANRKLSEAPAGMQSRQLVLNRVGVEKVRDRNVLLAAIIAAIEFFLSPLLSGSFQSRGCRLAEEPH